MNYDAKYPCGIVVVDGGCVCDVSSLWATAAYSLCMCRFVLKGLHAVKDVFAHKKSLATTTPCLLWVAFFDLWASRKSYPFPKLRKRCLAFFAQNRVFMSPEKLLSVVIR